MFYWTILAGIVATLLYNLCSDHYEWLDYQYKASSISYADRYTNNNRFTFENVFIPVSDAHDNAKIHGWLLTPISATEYSFPVVVMAHGLGAQKDMGLLNYGETFADAGYAVFIMDYRYFGGSVNSGNKGFRNMINPWSHIDDIKTVVLAIQQGVLGKFVDNRSIILWGTSFAGGHMLKVARDFNSIDSGIIGVISQVPHLDGKAASKRAIISRGLTGTLRVVVLSIADFVISGLLEFAPIYVKIVGGADETAYMILDEEEQKIYRQKHPKEYLGGWRNLAPARTMAVMSLYSPIHYIKDIHVPILFIAATNDSLCPIEIVRQAKDTANNATLLTVQGSHFELYNGENLKIINDAMVEFLHKL